MDQTVYLLSQLLAGVVDGVDGAQSRRVADSDAARKGLHSVYHRSHNASVTTCLPVRLCVRSVHNQQHFMAHLTGTTRSTCRVGQKLTPFSYFDFLTY